MPLKRAVLPLLDVARRAGRAGRARPTPSCSTDGGAAGPTPTSPGMVAALAEAGVTRARRGDRPRRRRHGVLRPGRAGPDRGHARSRRVRPPPRRPTTCEPWPAGSASTLARGALGGRPAGRWSPGSSSRRFPPGSPTSCRHAVPAVPGTLFDVVYDPWPTALAAQWTVRAGTVVCGPRPARPPGRLPGAADDRPRGPGRRPARRPARTLTERPPAARSGPSTFKPGGSPPMGERGAGSRRVRAEGSYDVGSVARAVGLSSTRS